MQWVCRSGEKVGVGDRVAIMIGFSTGLVADITGGDSTGVQCVTVRGGGRIYPPGHIFMVKQDQLLQKVPQ